MMASGMGGRGGAFYDPSAYGYAAPGYYMTPQYYFPQGAYSSFLPAANRDMHAAWFVENSQRKLLQACSNCSSTLVVIMQACGSVDKSRVSLRGCLPYCIVSSAVPFSRVQQRLAVRRAPLQLSLPSLTAPPASLPTWLSALLCRWSRRLRRRRWSRWAGRRPWRRRWVCQPHVRLAAAAQRTGQRVAGGGAQPAVDHDVAAAEGHVQGLEGGARRHSVRQLGALQVRQLLQCPGRGLRPSDACRLLSDVSTCQVHQRRTPAVVFAPTDGALADASSAVVRRGFGVVRFASQEDAEAACQMHNNTQVEGRTISVRIDRFD